MAEHRYQAVLAVIADGLGISQAASKFAVSRQTLHALDGRRGGGGTASHPAVLGSAPAGRNNRLNFIVISYEWPLALDDRQASPVWAVLSGPATLNPGFVRRQPACRF